MQRNIIEISRKHYSFQASGATT